MGGKISLLKYFNMTHKIIQIENYLLVGNDNNSKRGWFYCFRTKNLFQDEGEDVLCCNGDMNIIAHLPLNNSPIMDGVDLLPPLEDEVEKLAYKYNPVMKLDNEFIRTGFKAGYNKAKEKYKYTEDDVIDFTMKMISQYVVGNKDIWNRDLLKETLSLKQPKLPIEFECEIEKKEGRLMVIPPCKHCIKPKTITNSKGINQWVGKYIFD
jgi:hypothetical protein